MRYTDFRGLPSGLLLRKVWSLENNRATKNSTRCPLRPPCAPTRRTSGYGRPMHGENSTTSRMVGTLPCLMTSKEQSSWPRWNPSCYMVQKHGRLLQCKMAATQVCSGWCSTLNGGIRSGMRFSMEISLESLQKSGRRMAGHMCPTPWTGCKQPRSMGTDAGTSFTRRPVFD